jgi:hypothetical protein
VSCRDVQCSMTKAGLFQREGGGGCLHIILKFSSIRAIAWGGGGEWRGRLCKQSPRGGKVNILNEKHFILLHSENFK